MSGDGQRSERVRRRRGGPWGKDEVRRALLDASGRLFAERGVDQVSLRDVASEAGVNVALIDRYIGNREELIRETFADLGHRLAEDVLERPLEGHGFEPDSTMVRWTRIAAYLAVTGAPVSSVPLADPVVALAQTIQTAYGLDERAARLRGAQILASALGWRLFEPYLIAAGALDATALEELRADLTAAHRRLGATPWPSPESPAVTGDLQ
jgi:TetR/AcrR family transcriptional regulator, repressor for neighboring sulfatase